ncbi:MAG: hypothetical protein II800_04565 [Lachnospiraceae bacterium]|nr:hypothetical protein [Lachnospiraceae bacterium]
MSDKKINLVDEEALEEVSGGTAMNMDTYRAGSATYTRNKGEKAIAGNARYVRAKGSRDPVTTDMGTAKKGASDPFSTGMC